MNRIGLGEELVSTETLLRRHLALPARLTTSGRRLCPLFPEHWLWQEAFLTALAQRRAIWPLLE